MVGALCAPAYLGLWLWHEKAVLGPLSPQELGAFGVIATLWAWRKMAVAAALLLVLVVAVRAKSWQWPTFAMLAVVLLSMVAAVALETTVAKPWREAFAASRLGGGSNP